MNLPTLPMDNNNTYDLSLNGATNNPLQLQGDVRGARDYTSHSRFTSIPVIPRLDDDHQSQIVTQNPYPLFGTDDWNRHDDDPVFRSLFPLDTTSSETTWGYHNYGPIQNFPSDHILGDIGPHEQYIPDRELDESMEDVTSRSSDQVLDSDMGDHSSVAPFYSTGSDETVMAQKSDFTQIHRHSNIGSSIVDSTTTNGTDFEHEFDSPTTSSRFEPNILEGEAQLANSHRGTLPHSGQVMTTREGDITNTTQIPLRGTCITSYIMKKKYANNGTTCKCYEGKMYQSCLILEQLLPLTTLDLYTDLDHTMTKCSDPETTPLRRNAKIFLHSGIDQPNHYLTCEIDVFKLSFSDPAYSALKSFGLWEDMQSRVTEAQVQRDDVLSCSLVRGTLPSIDECDNWVLESAQVRRTGALGELQGALFKCSRSYIKVSSRPLHELVKLAIIYTSLYSICQSRSSIVLENQYKVRFRVCPRLRAEIFTPLFLESGTRLFARLRKAVKDYPGSPERKYLLLPLYLATMMLYLTYLHCYLVAENQRAFFLGEINNENNNTNSPTPRRNVPKTGEELRTQKEEERLQMRVGKITNLMDQILHLQQDIFRKNARFIGPLLETDIKPQHSCNKGGGKRESRVCCQDEEFKREIIFWRRALRKQQLDMEKDPPISRSTRFGHLLQQIVDSGSCGKEEGDFDSDVDLGMANPPPTEATPSSSRSGSNRENPGYSYPFLQEMEGTIGDMVCEQDPLIPSVMDEELLQMFSGLC